MEKHVPKLRVLIKNLIRETCADTALQGIPQILKQGSHTGLRLLWTFCFLICSGACAAFIVLTFIQYFSYSSYLSVQTVQEIPTQFPKVTFCNIKTLNYTYSPSYYLVASQVLTGAVFSSPLNRLLVFNGVLRTFFNLDPSLTNTTRKDFGYKIEDMLISCFFNYLPCTANDFKYFYSALYGNCYTFNGGFYNNGSTYNIKTVSLSGQLYGLQLELYAGDPNNILNEYQDGFIFSIQNKTAEPFWQGNILKVETGMETDFIMKRNFIHKLPPPYGNCLADTSSSPYYDFISKSLGNSYSQELCLQVCLQDLIIQNCGCMTINLPFYKNSSLADSQTKTDCYQAFINNYGSNNKSTFCTSSCPYECDSTEFMFATSKLGYPTAYHTNTLDQYLLNKGIRQKVNGTQKAYSKVNIYYQSMEYTTTNQTRSMEDADLMSNFGGNIQFYKFCINC